MNARFLAPGSYGPGDDIDLPDDEAQHLTRVLRLRAGDPVRVFDGRGREFAATVTRTSKAGTSVRIGESHAAAPEPRVAITIAHAVLKGDKMDDVVRDAVMIGAAAIQPIVTHRTEIALDALRRGRRRERWERVAVSSAKQCGRAVVPSIAEPVAFDALLDALRALEVPEPAFMLVEPGATGEAQVLSEIEAAPPREATLLIGPEGGWTSDEVDRAAAVCRLITLGGRTLRADAMGIAAIAALFAIWKEF
ncbi:MAG TPA: 16S rRNA (uracil(1498)-N(3))-methyltransferase [Vicinamibacterales bacterium]|nr:16S rRNA (uracil(1498)-N(3))-methyltransferase [Vicinamibacterales bacterium]